MTVRMGRYHWFWSSLIIIVLVLFTRWRWQATESLRFVRNMGIGFNLGNTLDVHDLHFDTNNPYDFETYWGNPVTTQQMIADIKAAGFDVLRIPVSWEDHLDQDGTVHEEWMDRVQQVVDYALQEGVCVIINAHHDSWYTPDDDHLDTARKTMSRLWYQISERFASYDERLLFESMNEPRLIGTIEEWTVGTAQAREIVNELNDVFVRTVRASGGMNEERYLLLPTYCARTETTALQDFRLPEGKRLILSVHLYAPFDFALNPTGTRDFSANDALEIERIFKDLQRLFIKRDIPVIITEFSAIDKGNEQQRSIWVQDILMKSKQSGIACIWWDAGGPAETGKPYPLYNRTSRQWLFPDLIMELTGIAIK